MNKENSLKLMVNVFQEENKKLCMQSGMSESETDEKLSSSEMTIYYIMGIVYDEMQKNNILNS